MNHFRTWLSAAVVVGVSAPVHADDKPTARPTQTTLFDKMFAAKKPSGPAAKTGTAAPARRTVNAPHAPEVLADALRAEQEAYLRRVSVCSELRRVGAESNDESLIRQADELERQAAALYNQRVAALGVPKVKADEPTGLGANFQPAGAKAAAAKLTAPKPPEAAAGTAQADIIREVKP